MIRPLLLAIVLLSTPVYTEAEMSRVLPRETISALWVDDFPALVERLEANPLARDLMARIGDGEDAVLLPLASADQFGPVWPALTEFLSDQMRRTQRGISDPLALRFDDLASVLRGGFAVYTTEYQRMNLSGREVFSGNIILAIEFDEDTRPVLQDLLRQFLSEVPSGASRTRQRVHGNDVFRISYTREQATGLGVGDALTVLIEEPVVIEYVFTEQLALFAKGRNVSLASTLRHLNSTGDAFGLTGTEGWRRLSIPEVSRGEVRAYADVAQILEQREGSRDQRDLFRVLTPLGITGSGPLLLSISIEEEALSLTGLLGPSRRPVSLFDAFGVSQPNEARLLPIIPDDALGYTSVSLDPGRAWRLGLSILASRFRERFDVTRAFTEGLEAITRVPISEMILSAERHEFLTFSVNRGDGIRSAMVLATRSDEAGIEAARHLLVALTEGPIQLFDLERDSFLGRPFWRPFQGSQTEPLYLAPTALGLLVANDRQLLTETWEAIDRLAEGAEPALSPRLVPLVELRESLRIYSHFPLDESATGLDLVGPSWWAVDSLPEGLLLRLSINPNRPTEP